MGLSAYFLRMTNLEQQNHYFALVKFWASVCWHYPTNQNKQVLSQNISLLALTYRIRTEEP